MPELRRGTTATSATISPSASSWKAPTMCPTTRRSTPCSRASRERYAGGTRSSISSVTARSRKAGRPTRARRSIGRATGGWSQAVLVAWAEPQAKPGSMGIAARPSPGFAVLIPGCARRPRTSRCALSPGYGSGSSPGLDTGEFQGKIIGYAVSCRLFSAAPVLCRIQALGHLCGNGGRHRRIGGADRVFPLAAREGADGALAEPRDHRHIRRRDASASRRDFHQVEAHGSVLALRRYPRHRAHDLPPQPDRGAHEGPHAPGPGLGASDLDVGRLPPRHGRRQPLRRIALFDRRLGQLQGLGRDRTVFPAGRRDGRIGRALPARPAMTDVPATLRTRLADLSPVALEIEDDSAAHIGHAGAAGGGGHFSLLIVSEAFNGVSRLKRHQTVMARVADLLPNPIHALSIRALAPEEFY